MLTSRLYREKEKKVDGAKKKKRIHSARPLGREALCDRTVRTPLATALVDINE